jgi:hypothetical protein
LADRPGDLGSCATALTAIWWFVLVLSLMDPHLYLRGAGDLLFVLVGALTGRLASGLVPERDPAPERRGCERRKCDVRAARCCR